MSFVDLVSGATVERLPEQIHIGRWRYSAADGGMAPYINGQPMAAGDVVVPSTTGHWAVLYEGESRPTRGRFFAGALPNDQDAAAFRDLGRLLGSAAKIEGGWLEWCDTSPLAPGLEQAVEPHPLEERIEEEMKHLAEVCRSPRTHIRIETERVLVSRARRIDPAAPTWLASHTEDWNHRTVSGVHPRRILAEVRDEQWDLYENRVAARLVDNLVAWLRRRIADVRRVLDDIFKRLEEFGTSTTGNRHRMNRIYSLWGEAWDASHGRDAAEQTLVRLEELLYRLLGLMDSPLYKNVPQRAQVPRALRMTNLLSNDDHYRGVARLWHAWSQEAVPKAIAGEELYALHQQLCTAYARWCMLLVVRACEQVRLEPVESDYELPFEQGVRLGLAGGLDLQWKEDGEIQLVSESRALVRFIPLLHSLEHDDGVASITARAASITEAAAELGTWTVILHPAQPGSPPLADIAGIADPPAPDIKGAIDFARVSPFSLDSVERVARAIRWAILAPRMIAYPPIVSGERGWVTKGATWFDDRGSSGVALLRPLDDRERRQLDLGKKIADAQAERDRLVAQREEAAEELRRVIGDRRQRADANRQKRDLLKPCQDAAERAERLEAIGDAFAAAQEQLNILANCPICGEQGQISPRPHVDGFHAKCPSDSCEAEWELRYDPEAKARIPILLPGSRRPDTWPVGALPQWVDDVLGCDVLAVPVVLPDGVVAFRPPRTVVSRVSN